MGGEGGTQTPQGEMQKLNASKEVGLAVNTETLGIC
jgi:hypothetical protein